MKHLLILAALILTGCLNQHSPTEPKMEVDHSNHIMLLECSKGVVETGCKWGPPPATCSYPSTSAWDTVEQRWMCLPCGTSINLGPGKGYMAVPCNQVY